MRLGIVIDRFDPERGGAERYLGELARRLARRGHEVRAYCRSAARADGAVPVEVVARARTRAGREREFAARACERARADGCAPLLGVRHVVDVDVYQPHGGTWAAASEARLRCEPRRWRRAVRAFARKVSAKQRYFSWADREVFARNPGLLVLAVSEMVRADVLARYGAHRPRVEVAWPAVDVERFGSAGAGAAGAALRAAHEARPGAPLIAFVGHDFELKGLARAIDALVRSDAFARGARLLVAGRGRRAPYAERARALGAEGSVRFLDAPADVTALLRACDALLHPTRFDPCALATLEALAAGIPAVTTSANGASPLVERGGGRVVGDEAGAESLAAALDSVLADPAARGRAREAGKLLGWDAHLDRVEPLLERGWTGARADARP